MRRGLISKPLGLDRLDVVLHGQRGRWRWHRFLYGRTILQCRDGSGTARGGGCGCKSSRWDCKVHVEVGHLLNDNLRGYHLRRLSLPRQLLRWRRSCRRVVLGIQVPESPHVGTVRMAHDFRYRGSAVDGVWAPPWARLRRIWVLPDPGLASEIPMAKVGASTPVGGHAGDFPATVLATLDVYVFPREFVNMFRCYITDTWEHQVHCPDRKRDEEKASHLLGRWPWRQVCSVHCVSRWGTCHCPSLASNPLRKDVGLTAARWSWRLV